jgi:trehalose utilization protein
MNGLFHRSALIVAIGLLPAHATAGEKEKDVFNYVAQQEAPKNVKKIVFVADPSSHGPRGNHEFMAGSIYMARTLNKAYDNVYAVVYPNYQWPKDLAHADAIIVLLNHGGSAVNPAVQAAIDRGAGFMAVHYGVEVNKGKQGEAYHKWIGGYFETFWSVNPFWTPKFDKIPQHETTRGVKPFSVNDEWYYHMRFVSDMKDVTPILTDLPDIKTTRKEKSSHGGNPDVYADVLAGKPQHMAWAFVRPDGGRGFGFTGYHRYENLKNDDFRTLLLNAVAWVTRLDVPSGGVPSRRPTDEELTKLADEGLRFRK